jgi:hypothetical protein
LLVRPKKYRLKNGIRLDVRAVPRDTESSITNKLIVKFVVQKHRTENFNKPEMNKTSIKNIQLFIEE